MLNFPDQGIGLFGGERDGFPDGVAVARRSCIVIIDRRQGHPGKWMHSGNPSDVAVLILQRDLAGVDEGQSRGSETNRDGSRRALQFQPVMGPWATMLGPQFEGYKPRRRFARELRLKQRRRRLRRGRVWRPEAIRQTDAARTRVTLQKWVGAKGSDESPQNLRRPVSCRARGLFRKGWAREEYRHQNPRPRTQSGASPSR